jgi:hypothetical protein
MTVRRSEDRKDQVVQLRKLAAAIREHFVPNLTSLYFKGRTRPALEAAEYLESSANRIEWIYQTDQELTVARRARDDDETELRGLVVRVNNSLEAALTSQSPRLLDAGVSPRKIRTKKTAEQMVEVASKAMATRRALGTRGPKQKKQAIAEARVKQLLSSKT